MSVRHRLRRAIQIFIPTVALLLTACGGGAGKVCLLLEACGGATGSVCRCSDDTQVAGKYSLGGTVSDLDAGEVLQLTSGKETLTRSANGSFTFAKQIAPGDSYDVKVLDVQSAWQTCSVSNATGKAISTNVTSVVVNCVSRDKATGLLNDTGIDWCSENITTADTWVGGVVCNAVNWVGNLWGQQQDAFFGRDAQAKAGTLKKVGGGMAGFDFTKVSSTGRVLAKQDGVYSESGTEAAGTQWDCVRDNVTGLVWEVKRNNANHLRHMDHTYTWYNPDSATNGGSEGTEGGGSVCKGVADENKCNTQSYVTAVNTAGLCGKKDWRMPTVDELRSLHHAGSATDPAIDTGYFPNTSSNWTWSSLSDAGNVANAWSTYFDKQGSGEFSDGKEIERPVRLVRSRR